MPEPGARAPRHISLLATSRSEKYGAACWFCRVPAQDGLPCEKIEWQDNPSGGRFGPRSETGRRRYRYRGKSRSSPARKPRAVERLLGPEPVIRTRRRRCCSIRCSCLRAAPRLRRSQGARRAGRPPARAVSTIFRQKGGVSDRGPMLRVTSPIFRRHMSC